MAEIHSSAPAWTLVGWGVGRLLAVALVGGGPRNVVPVRRQRRRARIRGIILARAADWCLSRGHEKELASASARSPRLRPVVTPGAEEIICGDAYSEAVTV